MFEPNNETIQAVIIMDSLTEVISEMAIVVNDETLGVEIAPLALYCQKTGHIIGARDENSLFFMIKIHGKENALRTLYNATSLNVHPAWIETNGEALDKLLEADPIGYAVYCFGIMTAQFYQNKKNSNPKLQPWGERYWALARANALLRAKGVADLLELNNALQRAITFMPDTTSYLYQRHAFRKLVQSPDQLALLHCSGDLVSILNEATNRALDSIGRADIYIKRTRFIDFALTPADAARGPSNIRKQKNTQRNIAEATMFGELKKLFNEAGIDFTPSDGAWKNKYRSNTQESEAAMLADLEAFGGSNLLTPENDEDEDMSVEVRTLAIPVSHGESSTPEIENDNTNDELEIASDIIAEMAEPIAPIMVEIARQVLENVVETVITSHKSQGKSWAEIGTEIHQQIDTEINGVILRTETPLIIIEQKPMTALDRLRAKKGQ